MINDISDYKIYINVENKLKYEWKYNRDISSRNYNKTECLLQINRRKLDFINYIEIQKNNANYFLDINDNNIKDINIKYNEIIDNIKSL